MAAPASTGLIDPTKPAKYPVILSDALLGKPSHELYTGIRQNHREALSSDSAPNLAKLRPVGNDTFDLSYTDDGDKYSYQGERTTNDGRCILVFDPARKVFVLHKLDSTFHMNLTKTPSVRDPELQYPPLETKLKPLSRKDSTKSAAGKGAAKGSAKKVPGRATKPAQTKAEPAPKQSKPSQRRQEQDDDEDDDDDGGIEVEYPEGDLHSASASQHVRNADFSPAFPASRSTAKPPHHSDSEDDADAEYDDDDEDEEEERDMSRFKLPSPVKRPSGGDEPGQRVAMEMDIDDELEAELEKELEKEMNRKEAESEVSEEED